MALLAQVYVCMHSEAKQTEMLEFGTQRGFLQGHARRQVARGPQSLDSLNQNCKAFSKPKEEGFVA